MKLLLRFSRIATLFCLTKIISGAYVHGAVTNQIPVSPLYETRAVYPAY